jgi:hypothetical protein
MPGDPPLSAAAAATSAPSKRAERYGAAVHRLASSLKHEYSINLMLFCFFFR